MAKIGYARVSTSDQNLAIQIDELAKAGCTRIVEEVGSGGDDSRPLLAQLLAEIEPGDILVVVRLDRIARSLKHLLDILDVLKGRGAFFRALADPVDTSSPTGRLVTQVIGAVAEFELSLIKERTSAGVQRAMREGKVCWNPNIRKGKKSPEKVEAGKRKARQKADLSVLKRVAPAITLLRPALPWQDVVRVVEALYPIKTSIARLERLAAVGVREKVLSAKVLEAKQRLNRKWRLAYLVRAIDRLAPEGAVKDIIDTLWKMQEPSPTGGRKWTELQTLQALTRGRDLLDKGKTLTEDT